MERLQLVGVRNANWHHHGEHPEIAFRCFNVNLDNEPENSKSTRCGRELEQVVSSNSPFCQGIMMTKKCKRLFERICSEENLAAAFRKARRGKSNKNYVRSFEKDLYNELYTLREELETDSYEPMPLHRFVIRDPKTRVIHAPAFRDRVVHHAINNIIEPIFDKTFIYDSYASRKGKGTHAALRRFDVFKKKVSRNGLSVPHARDNNMVCGWALKADIKHYFPSIDHKILMNLIRRKISDRKLTALLDKIIDAYATTECRGMPLGALTSQLFANIYLNPMDHFIKEKLNAKFYLRYLDDFMILHASKEQLFDWRDEIKGFLLNELNMEIHSQKTSIFPIHRGVPLLGFRCFYHYRLTKKNSVRYFLEKYNSISDVDVAQKSLEGWFAHISWANTYSLRQRIEAKFLERNS